MSTGGWSEQAVHRHRAPARWVGLPGWAAVVLLLLVVGAGGLLDATSGATTRPGFNYGLIIGAALAVVLVRRVDLWTVIVAPPAVYAVTSLVVLLAQASNGESRRKLFIGATSNWLVYGFPALVGATVLVVVVAVVRVLWRRRARSAERARSAQREGTAQSEGTAQCGRQPFAPPEPPAGS